MPKIKERASPTMRVPEAEPPVEVGASTAATHQLRRKDQSPASWRAMVEE